MMRSCSLISRRLALPVSLPFCRCFSKPVYVTSDQTGNNTQLFVSQRLNSKSDAQKSDPFDRLEELAHLEASGVLNIHDSADDAADDAVSPDLARRLAGVKKGAVAGGLNGAKSLGQMAAERSEAMENLPPLDSRVLYSGVHDMMDPSYAAKEAAQDAADIQIMRNAERNDEQFEFVPSDATDGVKRANSTRSAAPAPDWYRIDEARGSTKSEAVAATTVSSTADGSEFDSEQEARVLERLRRHDCDEELDDTEELVWDEAVVELQRPPEELPPGLGLDGDANAPVKPNQRSKP